jgi:hypothetical protein
MQPFWKPTTAALSALALFGAGAPLDALAAPRVEVLHTTDAARPGGTATFTFAVHGVSRCTLIAPGDRQTAITREADRVTFEFTLSSGVKPGRRWVVARCAGVAAQKFPLQVLPLAGTSSRPRAASRPLPTTSLKPATPEQAAARAWWAGQADQILSVFRNGQCTDWASQKRPDIVERIEEAAHAASLDGTAFPEVDFIAKDWATFARLAGMTVRSTPVAGALVVWQPGVEGAAPEYGHVGYVESVTRGRFTTSEENFGAPYVMGSRTLSTAPVAGRLFIYP